MKFFTIALCFKSIGSLGRVVKLFLAGQAVLAPSGPVSLVLALDKLLSLVLKALGAFYLLKPDKDVLHVRRIADADRPLSGGYGGFKFSRRERPRKSALKQADQCASNKRIFVIE